MSKSNKTFIVLGMGRSATSLVAKCLHEGGIDMGEGHLLGPGVGNEHGHFEDMRFTSLNNNILIASGGTWDNPPNEIATTHEDEIEELIQQRDNKPLWGWKDPRTALTIEKYSDKLGDPIFVTVFRNPKKVAESLHKRDGTSLEQGESLAREYNRRIVKFLTERYT